jgi:hypothetical protein
MDQFTLREGVVYVTTGSEDAGPGKIMQDYTCGGARHATHVYVAYLLQPGTNIAVAVSGIFSTEDECRKFVSAHIELYEIRTAQIVRRGDTLNVFGAFSVLGGISVENGIVAWNDIILTRRVNDVPAGARLKKVQLTGRTLIYYAQNNIEIGRENVLSSW